MALTNAEKQRRFREKLKKDPEKHKMVQEKHRQRYHKTKRLVGEMTKKEKNYANIIWKLRKQNLRDRKKTLEHVLCQTDKSSATSSNARESPTLRDKKKKKKATLKIIRQNKKLKKENEQMKKEAMKYKKRYERLIKKREPISTESKVTKKYNLLCKNMKATYNSTKSLKEKSLLKNVFMRDNLKQSGMKTEVTRDILGLQGTIRISKPKKKDTELRQKIRAFFLRDDVSRNTAGKKETVTKYKKKVQKRFLLDTMGNLYKTFKKEAAAKCSYYYFTKNRPFYVVAPSIDGRDTCLCRHHANAMYKAQALKKRGILSTSDLNSLIASTVCDVKSEECMQSLCNVCNKRTYTYNTVISSHSDKVKWVEWVRRENTYVKDGKTVKVTKNVKEVMEGEACELINKFETEMSVLKKHVYNITVQYRSYRNCIDKIGQNEAVILVDFSENYNCKHHEEIQSHHFGGSRKQITLHTVVMYTYDEKKSHKTTSFCTVSANNNHQPAAIWAHLHPILKHLKEEHKEVDTIHFFSDGPATQYRQKQNFYLVSTQPFDYGFKAVTWSFFEAGHGKGAADGIGGFLKRSADRMVANGTDIPDAYKFAQVLKPVSKIKVHLITGEEINAQIQALPSSIQQLPGTMKVHQVNCSKRGIIMHRNLSCFCNSSLQRGFCLCRDIKLYKPIPQPSIHNDSSSDGSSDERPNKAVPQPPKNKDSSSDTSSDGQPLSSLVTEKSKLKFQNQVPRKNVYKLVYGSSSEDEAESPKSAGSPKRSSGSTDISINDFLLVNVHTGSGDKTKSYTYASIAQSGIEDGEIKVMFLRAVDKNAKKFKIDAHDESYVPFNDIIEKLPKANLVMTGDRMYYEFPERVTIFEK